MTFVEVSKHTKHIISLGFFFLIDFMLIDNIWIYMLSNCKFKFVKVLSHQRNLSIGGWVDTTESIEIHIVIAINIVDFHFILNSLFI